MLAVVSQILLYLALAALLGFLVGYLFSRARAAERVRTLEREQQIRIEARDQDLQALRRETETRRAMAEQLQVKVDAAEVKRIGHESALAERDARIRALRSEFAASQAGADKDVEALRQRLREAEEQQRTRAKGTADLEAALAKARSAFERSDKEAAALRARLAESEAAQKELRAETARLRGLAERSAEVAAGPRQAGDRDPVTQELEARFQSALDAKEAELSRLRRRILELEGPDA